MIFAFIVFQHYCAFIFSLQRKKSGILYVYLRHNHKRMKSYYADIATRPNSSIDFCRILLVLENHRKLVWIVDPVCDTLETWSPKDAARDTRKMCNI